MPTAPTAASRRWRQAEAFRECGVVWFEEPVLADDLEGLHLIRDRGPAGMAIAAGEYGYDLWYFRQMLEAEAVDVLQADASRCAGITGFLNAATLGRSPRHGALRALRPVASCPGMPGHPTAQSHRVLPRSCAHRADRFRWGADAD